jgi:hypothetical protein
VVGFALVVVLEAGFLDVDADDDADWGDDKDKTVEDELLAGSPVPTELVLLFPAVPPRNRRQLVWRSVCCRLLGRRPGIWGGTKRRLLYEGRAETDESWDKNTPELIQIVVVVVHKDKIHTTFRKE